MNANIGMRYPVAAPVSSYTPGTGVTYGNGFKVAEAVSASLTWNRADGHFYGDDVELDSDNGVLGYTISFGPSGIKDSVRNTLLGETVASDVYTITDAAAPDVGFGYIRVMRSDGTSAVTTSYEAWWYFKLKFGISSEETRTKEKSIEWRVPTLEGTGAGISDDTTGALKFAKHKTFDTFDAAKSWLNSIAGIS